MGLEQVKNIDTLQAAQTRLTNSWIAFVRSIENGEGVLASFSKGALNFTSDFINGLANIDLLFDVLFKDVDELSNKQINKLLDLGLETDSGKEIQQYFSAIKNLPFEEISKNVDKYRDSFTRSLMGEGESLKESTIIFDAWFKQREVAFKAQEIFDNAIKNGITNQDCV